MEVSSRDDIKFVQCVDNLPNIKDSGTFRAVLFFLLGEFNRVKYEVFKVKYRELRLKFTG